MELKTRKYNLPDISLLEDKNWPDYRFYCWIPDRVYLVLGISNKAEKSVIPEQVAGDNIPILKRTSGGETVILTPYTLVLATTVNTPGFLDPQKFFSEINNRIIERLASTGINNLAFKGISDIAIGNKKILGSSIYRRKNKLFYHAVLNVAEPVETISRYIAHPKREPDYRKGRPHSDFVTSLLAEGYQLEIGELKNLFEK